MRLALKQGRRCVGIIANTPMEPTKINHSKAIIVYLMIAGLIDLGLAIMPMWLYLWKATFLTMLFSHIVP